MNQTKEILFGKILKKLRINNKYTQKQIAEYLNISSQAYSNYENNKRIPDINILYKISLFYNIKIDDLIKCCILGDEFESNNNEDSYINIILNENQKKIINDFLLLSDENQKIIHKIIKILN